MDLIEKVAHAARAATGAGERSRRDVGGEDAGPDVLTLLHEDHEKVKELFTRALDEKATAATRGRLSETIAEELTLHAALEERHFYPEMKTASRRSTEEREEVLEALEEHAAMKDAIKRLRRIETRDETQRAKLAVLCDLVNHHVEEEEDELFTQARALLGEEKLREIGATIAAAKQRKKSRAADGRAGRASNRRSRRRKKSTATRRRTPA